MQWRLIDPKVSLSHRVRWTDDRRGGRGALHYDAGHTDAKVGLLSEMQKCGKDEAVVDACAVSWLRVCYRLDAAGLKVCGGLGAPRVELKS